MKSADDPPGDLIIRPIQGQRSFSAPILRSIGYITVNCIRLPQSLRFRGSYYIFCQSQASQTLTPAAMTSLYLQSIPVLTKYLRNLSALLDKGRAFADQKNMKHEEMLEFRLIADMRG